MNQIKYQILEINMDSLDVKLLHTPLGFYLKKSFPRYYAKKLPHDTKIEISNGICKIYFSKTFYKKNKIYIFEKEKSKQKTNKKNSLNIHDKDKG